MANCVTLTKGRKLPCKSGMGGFKAIGLAPFQNNLLTGTLGEITSITGITASYRYELKNTGNTFTEEISADSDARNAVYTGTLNVVLQKLDLDTKNEIKMLAMGEVFIFVETYNGDVLVVGAKNGAELTGGNFTTGGARTDMQGFNLTFTSIENEPVFMLSTAAKAAYATVSVAGL